MHMQKALVQPKGKKERLCTQENTVSLKINVRWAFSNSCFGVGRGVSSLARTPLKLAASVQYRILFLRRR